MFTLLRRLQPVRWMHSQRWRWCKALRLVAHFGTKVVQRREIILLSRKGLAGHIKLQESTLRIGTPLISHSLKPWDGMGSTMI